MGTNEYVCDKRIEHRAIEYGRQSRHATSDYVTAVYSSMNAFDRKGQFYLSTLHSDRHRLSIYAAFHVRILLLSFIDASFLQKSYVSGKIIEWIRIVRWAHQHTQIQCWAISNRRKWRPTHYSLTHCVIRYDMHGIHLCHFQQRMRNILSTIDAFEDKVRVIKRKKKQKKRKRNSELCINCNYSINSYRILFKSHRIHFCFI